MPFDTQYFQTSRQTNIGTATVEMWRVLTNDVETCTPWAWGAEITFPDMPQLCADFRVEFTHPSLEAAAEIVRERILAASGTEIVLG